MRKQRKNGRYNYVYDDRTKARAILNVNVRRGKITRGPCEKCGKTEGVQGHHADYSKPLDVRWLCRTCYRNQGKP